MKIKIPSIKLLFLAFSVIYSFENIFVLSGSTIAADIEKGKKIFGARCAGCHGLEGQGDGLMSKFVNPPPRRFVGGIFKYKTTEGEGVPSDEDMFRVITNGLPGTAMPTWGDLLSKEEKLDVIAYEQSFAEEEFKELKTKVIDFSGEVPSSPESVAKGKELFRNVAKCVECHGAEGRGDGVKTLKDDIFFKRLWPRNLTQPWTFRGGSAARNIYTRITTGIQGTPMPSFATGPKALKNEDRWNIANYVVSIADRSKEAPFLFTGSSPGEILKCIYTEEQAPQEIDSPVWGSVKGIAVKMMRPINEGKRMTVRTDQTILVKCMFDKTRIAFLLEWDDRTRSVIGDERIRLLSENSELYSDAIAIQIPRAPIKPTDEDGLIIFGHKSKRIPVNIMQWSAGTVEKTDIAAIYDTNADGKINVRPSTDKSGFAAKGIYLDGVWKALITRELKTSDPADYQFIGTTRIPIAFAAWDGSKLEKEWRHALSNRHWLMLEKLTADMDILQKLYAKLSSYLVLKKFEARNIEKHREAIQLWKKEAYTWDAKDLQKVKALLEWADSDKLSNVPPAASPVPPATVPPVVSPVPQTSTAPPVVSPVPPSTEPPVVSPVPPATEPPATSPVPQTSTAPPVVSPVPPATEPPVVK